ncbi:ATP-binding protein [Streptomyces axinellae]|uniref:histidine kinase n=1 Tax=Streptomyces axinellae TaxID=552788 RepID=A0ABP6CEF4_9ACTN
MAIAVGTGPARPAVLIAGALATAAAAVCVERLLTCERRARQAAVAQQAAAVELQEHTESDKEDLERWLASLQEKHAAELSTLYSRLAEVTELHQVQLIRLADHFLPRAVEAVLQGAVIDDALRPLANDPDVPEEFRAPFRKVARSCLLSVEEEFDKSSSARNSVISIGSRLQVHTNKIRAMLHEMQGVHYGIPAVARDLMDLDQEIGPADCLAASIVVLGGADRPGRQWQTPQPLLSVVRGGIGRIKEFKRVQVRRLPELGVDGALVDHLTLIFAHLMDNAARYSPPAEQIIVSGREVPNGLGIEIQDAGTGLRAEKRRRAMRLLEGVSVGAGPGGLAEDAQLGLRVVGNLARKHGITVTFDDSPWLGTAVVVVVPHKFFKPLDKRPYSESAAGRPIGTRRRAEPVPAMPAPPPHGPVAAAEPYAMDEDGPITGPTTPNGLPKRSRHAREVPGPRHALGPATEGADTSSVPPEESFAGLAAFVTSGSPADGPEPHDRPDERRESD